MRDLQNEFTATRPECTTLAHCFPASRGYFLQKVYPLPRLLSALNPKANMRKSTRSCHELMSSSSGRRPSPHKRFECHRARLLRARNSIGRIGEWFLCYNQYSTEAWNDTEKTPLPCLLGPSKHPELQSALIGAPVPFSVSWRIWHPHLVL